MRDGISVLLLVIMRQYSTLLMSPSRFPGFILLGSTFLATLSLTMAAALTGSDICSTLASLLPGKVSLPSQALYDSSISSYYFGEEKDLSPTCIVSPSLASDVAMVIESLAGIPSAVAAIRGGGTIPFAGAANINNGVTIDLRGMNTVTVSSNITDITAGSAPISESLLQSIQSTNTSDSPIVSIGGGATWGDVYDKLTPLNLVAVGGRGASLGVGGLITGGWSLVLRILPPNLG